MQKLVYYTDRVGWLVMLNIHNITFSNLDIPTNINIHNTELQMVRIHTNKQLLIYNEMLHLYDAYFHKNYPYLRGYSNP